jgi:hypothetical protein
MLSSKDITASPPFAPWRMERPLRILATSSPVLGRHVMSRVCSLRDVVHLTLLQLKREGDTHSS